MKQQKKKNIEFLRKNNIYIQAAFVIITTILSGIFTNSISNIMIEDSKGFFSALKNMSTGDVLLLIIYVILFLVYIKFQDYIKNFPDKSIIKKRNDIINYILEVVTKALFILKFRELEVSAVIQLCEKEERKVAFNYNTISNNIISKKMPLKFGDVGKHCIEDKALLMKEYTHADWESQSYEYKKIVPKDLRYIIAQPICNDEGVIAVLEFDIFETTKESKKNSSKIGYLTDAIRVNDVDANLNNHKFRLILDKLSEVIRLLVDR